MSSGKHDDREQGLPDGLLYERFAPRQALAHIVEHYWLVAAPPISGVRSEILIPNGRPTVLVCLGDPGWRIRPGDGRKLRNAGSIAGPVTEPLVLQQSGSSAYLAAQLHPWGLAALTPGNPLVDEAMPLPDPEGWRASVTGAPLGEAGARVLENLLEKHVKPLDEGRLAQVTKAVALIDEQPGGDMQTYAGQLNLSYSSLYRLFRDYVGLSPKRYAGIMRYYRLVGGLLHGAPEGGLSQLALMQGYFDQAHATREFRRYTGVSQTAFRRSLNGIAKLMHST